MAHPSFSFRRRRTWPRGCAGTRPRARRRGPTRRSSPARCAGAPTRQSREAGRGRVTPCSPHVAPWRRRRAARGRRAAARAGGVRVSASQRQRQRAKAAEAARLRRCASQPAAWQWRGVARSARSSGRGALWARMCGPPQPTPALPARAPGAARAWPARARGCACVHAPAHPVNHSGDEVAGFALQRAARATTVLHANMLPGAGSKSDAGTRARADGAAAAAGQRRRHATERGGTTSNGVQPVHRPHALADAAR